MCGIAGSFGPISPDASMIAKTLSLMRNRGPDASGWTTLTCRGLPVTLLSTRLAIIDLDPRSDQPFNAEGITLVFNGEILNYLELREELRQKGHRFITESDTEVIVRSYLEYGPECVERFEGMWAIALVDERRQELFLSRDMFGKKPFFYLQAENTLYFASEVKALMALSARRPPVNYRHIERFLVNGYKSLFKVPETFFQGVHSLPAATSATVEAPSGVRPRRYWQLRFEPVEEMTREDAYGRARELTLTSMELRLRADVPVAFCLSGGVDSTVMAGLASAALGREVTAFSVLDPDPRYDESENVTKVVQHLGCKSHVVHTDKEDFIPRLRRLVAYHDAPVATISSYMQSMLFGQISGHGFKVALSGVGADEVFTGYYDHYLFWLAQHAEDETDPLVEEWKETYGRFVRNPVLQDPMVFRKAPWRRDHIFLDRDTFDRLLIHPLDEDFREEAYSPDPLRNRMLNELNHESVPLLLHEDDLNSMYHSVETRSPYLDRELATHMFQVPNRFLIRDGLAKAILREIGRGYVPDEVRLDHRKRGFNAPITSFMQLDSPEVREALLEPSPIFDIVDRGRLSSLMEVPVERNSRSKFLFNVVSCKLFLEQYETR